MLQTQTITTSTNNSHVSPQICLNAQPMMTKYYITSSPKWSTWPLRDCNAPVMLIEWGPLLYHRMNVPIIVKNFSYVVPDEQLTDALDILSSMGLPTSTPSRLLSQTEGDFYLKGHFYRITPWTMPSSVQHIALYPLSFSSLSLSELEKRPPVYLVPPIRCQSIHVPSRPAVYALIVRLMASYPRKCATMTVLRSDLSELIGYDLLELEGGYVDSDDEETLGVSERLVRASLIVEAWGTGVWRKGEEWIGDALNAVVVGVGSIEHLPSK